MPRPLVVDSQVHLNRMGLDAGIRAMAAAAVDAVLIDEWWGTNDQGKRVPNHELPNGATRQTYPFSVEAVRLYPHKFAYMATVDRDDPDLRRVMQSISDNPNQLGVRISISLERGDDAALEGGAYDGVFGAARQFGVPLMLVLPRVPLRRRAELILPHLRRWDEVRFILDHCGLMPMSTEDLRAGYGSPASLTHSHVYAECPNVAIKWGHAPLLSAERFPFSDLIPDMIVFLERFGADRIMWCSDITQVNWHHTWGESVRYISESDQLSTSEKQWLLGRSCQSILGWPPSPALRPPCVEEANV